ncbi:MAG TPA: hypothetical protein VGE46_08455 [Bdellovibrio sp.]
MDIIWNWTDISTTATCVATCLAAGGTLWTVREMQTQRNATVIPNLLTTSKRFISDESRYPFLWYAETGAPTTLGNLPRFALELINIGAGAAHTINLSWEIDIAGIVANAKDLPKSYSYDEGHEFMRVGKAFTRVLKNDFRFDISRPYHLGNDVISLSVPLILEEYFTDKLTHFDIGNGSVAQLRQFDSDFANTKLHISYKDTFNKSHSRTFQFRLDVLMFSPKSAQGQLVPYQVDPT